MNTPQSYVKKPVAIEAMQLVEGSDNWKDVCDWIHSTDSLTGNDHRPKMLADGRVVIDTLEGVMAASPGDWVIRGIKDEFYPCKPDIFEASYDKTASKA